MKLQPIRPQPFGTCLLLQVSAPLILIAGLLSMHATARSYLEVPPVDMNPRIDNVRAAFDAVTPTPRELTCRPGDFAIPAGGHFQGV